MISSKRLGLLASLAAALVLTPAMEADSAGPTVTLAAPESFNGISDTAARSAAMFTEAGKVLTSARCVNCHPAGDRPLQSEAGRMHQPPVERGADGFGLVSMRCSTCHQGANFEPAGMPGHAHWHLAPREMAWQGKTVGEICVQIKDPARNGGRTLAADSRPHGDGLAGRLGVGARIRPRAGAWHAEGTGRAPRGVDENRRGVSDVNSTGTLIACVQTSSLSGCVL